MLSGTVFSRDAPSLLGTETYIVVILQGDTATLTQGQESNSRVYAFVRNLVGACCGDYKTGLAFPEVGLGRMLSGVRQRRSNS